MLVFGCPLYWPVLPFLLREYCLEVGTQFLLPFRHWLLDCRPGSEDFDSMWFGNWAFSGLCTPCSSSEPEMLVFGCPLYWPVLPFLLREYCLGRLELSATAWGRQHPGSFRRN
jgi:hypothetical protein